MNFAQSNITVTIADLPAGALGQSTTTITLDTNAAGHGWFIDYTPWLNEEYLPTANPNVWQARPGSEAEGKMDMLSVLLHEYGHVLGIEHSADQHASMASTLTPGTRRLPTADELALMAQLVGEVKAGLNTTPETPPTSPLPLGTALGGFWLARMRKSGPGDAVQGSTSAVGAGSAGTAAVTGAAANTDTSATPQYAVAAHATLTNPGFTGGVGWSTAGTVTFDNGMTTLTESATAQTRLNQLFVLGAQDRFLRFTLADIALDDVQGSTSVAGGTMPGATDMNGAPDAVQGSTSAGSAGRAGPADAFEVALIDANTGLSLLGGTGLTRTDALLNFQADGTERIAPQVTRTLNAGGSRTYMVDLAGIAPGTVASLSFDLIGFGRNAAATSSHITVRDLTIGLGVPQTFDDTAITTEDAPVSIAVLTNDLDARQPGFAPVIVSGPTRGQVSINADGTFGYTPNANDFGSDSFTYQLTDGRVASNVATVSITVTPVNDAPVAAEASHATLEDTALVLDLLAWASDVDDVQGSTSAASAGSAGAATPSPVSGEGRLSARIVTGPAHGVLTANADGTTTYTPNADFNGADSFTYKVNDGERDSNLATVTLTVTSVNDAPQGAGATVATLEDTPYIFRLADFRFTDAHDSPANNVAAVTIATLPLAGTLTNKGLAVAAGQSITVADIIAGSLIFAPTANANGNNYASFTFRVQDDGGTINGGIDSDPVSRTLTINVTSVNDAPVASDAAVTTREDQVHVLDLRASASDVDDVQGSTSVAGAGSAGATSSSLSIIINSLPLDGLLQHSDGLTWRSVTAGQTITKADIDAGRLAFGPDANESGIDGYATTGTGNLKRDYASFTYQASDGQLLSGQATLIIDVTPVADTPQLTLSAPPGASGATAQMFATSWESAPNRNTNATVLPQAELEGWRGVTPVGDSNNHFIVWSSGDKMKDAGNTNRTVYAAPGNGNNWIELGDTQGNGRETYGIERTVTTRVGARYDLNFDYAGRPGYSTDYTRIGIYVDGVKIGSYANTSSNTVLNWQTVRLQFTGNGAAQTIRIVTEATASQSNGRGAMIDDLALTEQQPLNTGYQDSAIRLSAIIAALQDNDGSETLSLTLGAIPVGATLSDGTRRFTATAAATTATLTAWSLSTLTITPPAGYTGSFTLNVTARATETASNGAATQTVPLTVTVVPTHVTSPIVLDLNGDGIKTVGLNQTQGTFDLLNTGTPIRSGWLSNEDGFLALDTNGNGRIDNRNELFGGDLGEGYAKLIALDSNADGSIDAQDQAYAELKVWQDKNGNHQTDAGELHTLGDFNIRSLSLGYTIKPEQQHGNWLLEQSHATRTDGTTLAMADAYFEIPEEERNTRRQEDDVHGNIGVAGGTTAWMQEVEQRRERLPTMPGATESPRAAQITVQSKPAQPKVPDIPHGIFAVQGRTSAAGAANGPGLISTHEGPNKPLIQWTAKATNGSGDDDSTLTKNKKKPLRTHGWLDDFIGAKDTKHTDLAKATGLVVRIKAGEGERSV